MIGKKDGPNCGGLMVMGVSDHKQTARSIK
jgi:hypothetical protein